MPAGAGPWVGSGGGVWWLASRLSGPGPAGRGVPRRQGRRVAGTAWGGVAGAAPRRGRALLASRDPPARRAWSDGPRLAVTGESRARKPLRGLRARRPPPPVKAKRG